MTNYPPRSATSTTVIGTWGPWLGGYTSVTAAKRYLTSLGDIWNATEIALKEDGRWYVRMAGEAS